MLFAELLDDLGAGSRLVAEHPPASAVHERVDHVVRKAVRIGRHRLGCDHAHQLPVSRGRVLALRALDETARDGRRSRLRWTPLQRLDVTEAQRLQIGQVKAANRPGHVSERVRALVAVLCGIRELPGTHGIEHDDAGPRHQAILGRSC
jgi:hypothetical protein